MSWKNRIVGHGEQAAISFMANPLNWRIHPKAQRQALAGVLAEVGWVQSVIVNRTTGNVVDGHARIEEALKLGDETPVPFVEVELSEEEEQKMLLTLDPISAMAAADKGNLDALLRDVSTANSAVADMLTELAEKNGLEYGATIGGELEDVEPQVDRAEELRQKWGVESGQIWQLGEHRLMCGDSTSEDDVARLMNGEKIDFCFTSPPYNSGNGGYKTNYSGKTKRFYENDFDDRTEDEWVEFCDGVLKIVSAFLRSDDSPVLWNVMYTANCRSGYGRTMFAGSHGMSVKETICWDKGAGFPSASKGILSRNWELVFVLSRGEKYQSTQKDNEPRWAKWDISRPKSQNEIHKATFPIELAERAINDFCVDLVIYEPFSGTGTTMMAAEKLKKRCYAMEITPAYVAIALERWSQATGKTPQVVA